MKKRLLLICVALLAVLYGPVCSAQLFTFSKQELIDYTAQNPFQRSSDGRPKVPNELMERAKGLSSEEVWEVLIDKKFNNQYADGFQVLHPGKTMAGRAFTVQFMPLRSDVAQVANAKTKDDGIARLRTRFGSFLQSHGEGYNGRQIA